jgi:hypothetical protein
MTTLVSYATVGAKENVQDIISNISPTDTPMSSLMKSEKISARVHEWQEDALAAAAVNAAVEGADASMATLSATTMRTNNTQIFTKAFQVSNTVDAIAHYGRKKESALIH